MEIEQQAYMHTGIQSDASCRHCCAGKGRCTAQQGRLISYRASARIESRSCRPIRLCKQQYDCAGQALDDLDVFHESYPAPS